MPDTHTITDAIGTSRSKALTIVSGRETSGRKAPAITYAPRLARGTLPTITCLSPKP